MSIHFVGYIDPILYKIKGLSFKKQNIWLSKFEKYYS